MFYFALAFTRFPKNLRFGRFSLRFTGNDKEKSKSLKRAPKPSSFGH